MREVPLAREPHSHANIYLRAVLQLQFIVSSFRPRGVNCQFKIPAKETFVVRRGQALASVPLGVSAVFVGPTVPDSGQQGESKLAGHVECPAPAASLLLLPATRRRVTLLCQSFCRLSGWAFVSQVNLKLWQSQLNTPRLAAGRRSCLLCMLINVQFLKCGLSCGR